MKFMVIVDDIEYHLFDEEASVILCKSTDTEVIIPPFIEIKDKQYKVTSINFWDNNITKSVTVPDGIHLDLQCFKRAKNIEEIKGNPGYVSSCIFETTSYDKNIGNTYFVYDGTQEIPSGVIQVYGAPNKVYRTVKIPEGVKYVTGFFNCYINDFIVKDNVSIKDRLRCYNCTIGNHCEADNIYSSTCIVGNDCQINCLNTNVLKLGENNSIYSVDVKTGGFIPESTKFVIYRGPEVVPTNKKIAYKGFHNGLGCQHFVYKLNKVYTLTQSLRICQSGYHACYDPLNCLGYYRYIKSNEYHPVEILGDIQWQYNKIATNQIKVLPESLTLKDLIRIHNEIYECC